jgi:hypothetical protein
MQCNLQYAATHVSENLQVSLLLVPCSVRVVQCACVTLRLPSSRWRHQSRRSAGHSCWRGPATSSCLNLGDGLLSVMLLHAAVFNRDASQYVSKACCSLAVAGATLLAKVQAK